MFELPAVYKHDFEIYGTNSKVLAFFRDLEIKEIRWIEDFAKESGDCQPKYVERILRSRDLSGKDNQTEYVGLVTNGVYDTNGQLISDMFSDVHGKPTPRKFLDLETKCKTDGSSELAQQPDGTQIKQSESITFDVLSDETFQKLVFPQNGKSAVEVGREIVAINNGLEMLPRSTAKPRIWMDSPKIQQMVHDANGKNTRNLSTKATKILMRSNYRVPFGLAYSREDRWMRLHMRRRSLQVVSNILQLCLERRDHERAWTALCCIIRSKSVEPRLLWMPALELLAWRHSLDHRTKTPEQYLDWLIERNPKMPHSRQRMYRKLPVSTDFMPVSILMRLADGKYGEALDQAEQAVNSRQYTNDPTCWALCGLARLKVNRGQSGLRVQRDFVRCLELGGVLPEGLRQHLLKLDSSNEDVLDTLSAHATEEGLLSTNSEASSSSEAYDASDSENEDAKNSEDDEESEEEEMEVEEGEGIEDEEDNGDYDDDEEDEEAEKDKLDEEDKEKEVYDKAREEKTETSSAKSMKVHQELPPSDHEDDSDEHSDEPATQPFYSQAMSLGGELGSSSEDDAF